MKILEILTSKRVIGNVGENYAVNYLKENGYTILERNYVAKNHEIDIIAKKDGIISFIEVKSRTLGKESLKEPRPASAVTPEKQRKIISAASYYKKRFAEEYRARFDIIEVYLIDTKQGKKAKEIKHLIGAFDLSTNRKANYK